MKELLEAAFPWFGCAVALSAFALPLVLRNPQRRRDMQLQLNVGRASWGVFWGVSVFSALTSVGLGLVLVHRYSFAWGFFPLAASMLFVVGYQLHLCRLPFPDLEGDGAAEDEADPVD